MLYTYRFRLGFVNEFGEYVSEADQVSVKTSKKGVPLLGY